MGLADYVLYRIARRWPAPMRHFTARMGAEPGTAAYDRAYALEQFNAKVRSGLGIDVLDKDVLEIGCGHGGISCFLAAAGARSVTGIDLSEERLRFAEEFAASMGQRFAAGGRLPLTFRKMNAYDLSFGEESFDVVVADNAFEHFVEPERVMQQAYRVLRPGGGLLVPIFSSIYSKNALHLKHGLKMPWANLFFSEATIIRAMYRLAEDDNALTELYPGLKGTPLRVRDLRQHGDLNDITYARFLRMAARTGYRLVWFRAKPTRFGGLVGRIPGLRTSVLRDVLSIGATAYLLKPGSE